VKERSSSDLAYQKLLPASHLARATRQIARPYTGPQIAVSVRTSLYAEDSKSRNLQRLTRALQALRLCGQFGRGPDPVRPQLQLQSGRDALLRGGLPALPQRSGLLPQLAVFQLQQQL
jgi:hypothetical protein